MTTTDASRTASAQNPHGDGKYLPILDGWRAVAIILVLLFHGSYNSNLQGHRSLEALGLLAGRTGALGVLIFFCISGYLITHRLLVESRAKGKFSISGFYIKRVFRILPPLGAYLLVIVTLFLFGVISLDRHDWSAPLFLANYYGGSWYTSHFWSLSVEEHFYIFWPICAYFLGWRKAMWVGLGLIAGVALWRPLALQHTLSQVATLRHTEMRVDYIMMGAVVAIMTALYPRTIPAFKRIGSTPGLLVLLALLALTTLHAPVDLRSVQAVILTLLVCASTIADNRQMRWLLTSKPMLFIGKVSYSLYVWQEIFLAPTSNTTWSSPILLPLKLAVSLLVAYLSFRYVETPFIRYGRRVLKKREQRSDTSRVSTLA